MLDVRCEERFAEVVSFALENGCMGALLGRLLYLDQYGGDDSRCELYADFAPLSFGFAHVRGAGRCWMAGAMIYSGPGRPLGGMAPVLTVALEDGDASQHGWSCHT